MLIQYMSINRMLQKTPKHKAQIFMLIGFQNQRNYQFFDIISMNFY